MTDETVSARAQSPLEDGDTCPLFEPDDKYQEAHYFITQMMHQYHAPVQFRWNLNAFLQALRSVTFFIQKCLADDTKFSDWWKGQQDRMRSDSLLRSFVEGRNVVVKQRNLSLSSTAQLGMYRNRKLKLTIGMEVHPGTPSGELLEHAKSLGFVAKDHSAIGEEYGVRRTWKASELGDDNVLTLCELAWMRIGHVLAEAHGLVGVVRTPPADCHHTPDKVDLLTETDLDPSLAEKWGW